MWSISLAIFVPLVFAAPAEKRSAPTVTLDHATVVGSSLGGIDSFKGIPYAQPPTGIKTTATYHRESLNSYDNCSPEILPTILHADKHQFPSPKMCLQSSSTHHFCKP